MICFSDSCFKFLNNNLFPFREIKYHKDCTYNARIFPNEEACEKNMWKCKKIKYSIFHYIYKNKLQRVFICI